MKLVLASLGLHFRQHCYLLKLFFVKNVFFYERNDKNKVYRHQCRNTSLIKMYDKILSVVLQIIHSFIHQYSALEAGLAGTRAQSCDRYGSGTLHPGQVLGSSLPLLSPAFRRSHFRRQVPVRPQRRERSQQRKVELWARNFSSNFA